jgi:peptide deformylase
MAVREIVKLGDERLRQQCREVNDPTSPEIRRIVADLRDTLDHSYQTTGYGRGIAAPQIGEMVKVVYLSQRVLGKELVMVNPSIVAQFSRDIHASKAE